MSASSLIVITPGDPDGIGPEIVWKAIRSGAYRDRGIHILCVGARKPFDEIHAPVLETTEEDVLKGDLPPGSLGPVVWLLSAPTERPLKPKQKPNRNLKRNQSPKFKKKVTLSLRDFSLPGFQSGWSIEMAVSLIQRGVGAALVTGPISKERLQKGGYPYPGHTEFLAKLCRTPQLTPQVTMMLANDLLRITLVTTHLALKDVPRALRKERVRRTIEDTISHLVNWFGIATPRVAVAALNPHAGESGLFGQEEIKVIAPEIQALQKASHGKYTLIGPLPADTLFAKHIAAPASERFDAVVCMYHDQGLIPVKLLDFPRTVNVTLGLPIIRTSVDHGTSFDIARTGKADPSSLQAAIELAIRLAPNILKNERSTYVCRDQTVHLS